MIVCNVRNTQAGLTGVQRYTLELLEQFGPQVETIAPRGRCPGVRGHAWEQFVLPTRLRGRLLWSPSTTGPLSVERQVVTIHDLAPLDHPQWSNPRFSMWYRTLIPRLARRVRAILTVSQFSKSRIVEHCPGTEHKIHVVPLAAHSRFAPASSTAIVAMRQRLGIPSDSYFLALGSLEPRKNLHRTLEGWRCALSELPSDVWLVLAGSKGKTFVFGEQPLEPLPPRVHLTGHVVDELLPPLYSGAIGSVYLSLYEGFGLPPLESMACGTPVIASNATSLPEVVGGAGLAIDPLDTDAIAYAFVRLTYDSRLRDALRTSGLARAKLFDWRRTAEDTMSILKKACQS